MAKTNNVDGYRTVKDEENKSLRDCNYSHSGAWDERNKIVAKGLYFKGMAPAKVAELSCIPLSTLVNWIHGTTAGKKSVEGSWKYEREVYYLSQFEKIKEAQTEKFILAVDLGMDILIDHLRALKISTDSVLSVKDMKLLSDMISNIDRIVRLDAGKPTQRAIYEHKQSHDEIIQETKKELALLLSSDPMAEEDDEGTPDGFRKTITVN